MDDPRKSAELSTSSRLSTGDDPLSANATEITPPSTTPHLPKLGDIVRASIEHARYSTAEEVHYDDHDLEAMSLISSSSHGGDMDGRKSRQSRDEEDNETGFEAPTKMEKTMMITSIGVVVLFSVAAGLTTVCDWVL
ncbi:hypothetical protein QFC20_000026 [Naganishia adeliensis]|uniref:Uncharacterized protein n=1 Tax=Naganishia adeliensis TaxID=92952 RepID=A0ACC2X1V8_9TREE|nr:hypothetical protein QFC20_000026 [Naganishia adeliensis]